MRLLVSRMFQRTILACRSLNTEPTCSLDQTVSSAPSGRKCCLYLGLCGVDGFVTRLLVGDLVGCAQVVLDQAEHGGFEFRKVGDLVIARILGGDFRQLDDRVEHRLEATVAEHDSAEHDVFRQFLCFRPDHQNGVARAGDDEVELGFSHLVDVRVELVLAADVADASTADRAHERNARQSQCCRGGDDRHDVGIVFTIVLHDGDDDLGVVLVAVGEKRADRAVDEAGNQGFLLARAAFTLEVAAGNLAGGVGLFLVVDGQREEVEPGFGSLAETTVASTTVSP